jgi:LacI family transcriptional regulator
MRRVTSRDIAKRAGVSQTTVSFVLNDRKDIAIPAGTRERVLRVAKELNYVPNACARGLVSGRTRAIGVSAGRPTDPHYAGLLDDLLRSARDRGYHLLVVSGETDTAAQLLAEGRLDGVLAIGSSAFLDSAGGARVPGLPLVFVGLSAQVSASIQPEYLVDWDDAGGAAEVCRHLLDLGHRRIGMLAGAADESSPKVEGFLAVMKEAGQEPVLIHCQHEVNPYEAGREMLAQLLERYPSVTAAFCRNDLLAVGALSLAGNGGVPVPERLSVAGYTNMPVSAYTLPSLTTVATPIREAGRCGLDMLINLLEGKPAGPPHVRLPVRLIGRASTAPPPF